MDAYLKRKPDAKVLCDCPDCDWNGRVADLIIARRPTQRAPNLYGCPRCNNYDCIVAACSANGCGQRGTRGVPVKLEGGFELMYFCCEDDPSMAMRQ